jgi:hypothetical protein
MRVESRIADLHAAIDAAWARKVEMNEHDVAGGYDGCTSDDCQGVQAIAAATGEETPS